MKCPNCGTHVYAVDTLDIEWQGDSYYDVVEGCCRTCGKVWQWEEVYKYERDQNIHEINENDHL